MRIRLGYNPWYNPRGHHWRQVQQATTGLVPIAWVRYPPFQPMQLVKVRPYRSDLLVDGLYEATTGQWFLQLRDGWYYEVTDQSYQSGEPSWLSGLEAGDTVFYTLIGSVSLTEGLSPPYDHSDGRAWRPGLGERWILEWNEAGLVLSNHWIQVSRPICQASQWLAGSVVPDRTPNEIEVPLGLKPIVRSGRGQKLTVQSVQMDRIRVAESITESDQPQVSYIGQAIGLVWHTNLELAGSSSHLEDLCPLAGHSWGSWSSGRYANEGQARLEQTWYVLLRPSCYHDQSAGQKVAPASNDGKSYENLRLISSQSKTGPIENGRWPGQPHTLVLAELTVQLDPLIHGIRLWDQRRPGGGLDPEWLKTINPADEPQLLGYWDLGSLDGPPYQGHAQLIIQLPRELLAAYGGPFQPDEIETRIQAYLPAGIFWQIQYVA